MLLPNALCKVKLFLLYISEVLYEGGQKKQRRKERTKMNWNRQNLCLAYDSKLQKSAQKAIKAKS